MRDVTRRIHNCNKLYWSLIVLAIFTGCWCFLIGTIPVIIRLWQLYKLKGVYEKYNRFQQSYEEYCR